MARSFFGVLVLATVALLQRQATQAQRLHDLLDYRGHGELLRLSVNLSEPVDITSIQEAYFEQAVVDHSAPLSQRKFWRQRYFINEAFWAGRGYPVFLSIGGEGAMGPADLSNRFFINYLARKHRALLVAVEYRYYGKSYPTPDMTTENLQYLSSQQALHDLARFHPFLTEKYGLKNAPWVAFGFSYSGNLAAWVKLNYPALFVGAVASSAPLLAKSDFYEFNEVVGDGLRYFGGGECYRRVQQSIMELRELMDNGRDGRDKIHTLFSPCSRMTNESDDSVFESAVVGAFQEITQANLVLGTMTLTDLCNRFADESKPVLDILAEFLAHTRRKQCLDSKFEGEKQATIEILKNTTFDGRKMARQWFYQTCNEFGYFSTTSSKHSPFHPLQTITEENIGLEVCKRVFNINVSPDITSTNVEYGALEITVENVTFPSGTIDPWHTLGVNNKTFLHSSTSEAVYIEGTSHCADIFYPIPNDSAAIQWAHTKIAANVAHYLGQTPSPERAID